MRGKTPSSIIVNAILSFERFPYQRFHTHRHRHDSLVTTKMSMTLKNERAEQNHHHDDHEKHHHIRVHADRIVDDGDGNDDEISAEDVQRIVSRWMRKLNEGKRGKARLLRCLRQHAKKTRGFVTQKLVRKLKQVNELAETANIPTSAHIASKPLQLKRQKLQRRIHKIEAQLKSLKVCNALFNLCVCVCVCVSLKTHRHDDCLQSLSLDHVAIMAYLQIHEEDEVIGNNCGVNKTTNPNDDNVGDDLAKLLSFERDNHENMSPTQLILRASPMDEFIKTTILDKRDAADAKAMMAAAAERRGDGDGDGDGAGKAMGSQFMMSLCGDEALDDDDDDEMRPARRKRKNRMGQRARQQLAERLYGDKAKHVKKQKVLQSKHNEKEEEGEENMHPSWIAKRKQRQMMQNIHATAAQCKKITF